MHELSICHSLMAEVERVAEENGASRVTRVVVRIGPLSGVEPELLKQAYPLATAGGVAEGSELMVEPAPVRVRCMSCGAESDASPNRLLCAACGDFKTRLLSGDELLLASVELEQGARH